MYDLFKLFIRSKRTAILGSLISLVSGVSSVLMIAFINRTMRTHSASSAMIAGFLGVCVFTVCARMGSQLFLIRIAQGALLELRMSLSRKVTTTSLRKLETMGFGRLLPILTEDVSAVIEAVAGVPLVLANGAIIVSCLAYLAWVSPKMFALVTVCLALGQSVPWLLRGRAREVLKKARLQQNVTYQLLRGLLDGNKELKLNERRRVAFLDETLLSSYETFRTFDSKRRFLDTSAATWSKMMGLFIVGAVLFLPVQWDPAIQVTFVTTLLFMMGSFDVVQNFLPIIARAQASLVHIESLEKDLSTEKPAGAAPMPASFEEVRLSAVTHTYFNEQAKSFALGPIDLVFKKGELIFLVGGNGSGKSTLAKTITGLYSPEGGAITVDGRVIDDETRASYRQLFSVVFADFHLFDTIQGTDSATLDSRAAEYLRKLQLDHKVTVSQGSFSTTSLSQGQRKRLALLVAYLEDRPFYVFDEWAADQDPSYKDIFYRQLLPELRERGKTVLVISHDDRYFDVADRVIKLDYGKIVSQTEQAAPLEVPAPPAPVRRAES